MSKRKVTSLLSTIDNSSDPLEIIRVMLYLANLNSRVPQVVQHFAMNLRETSTTSVSASYWRAANKALKSTRCTTIIRAQELANST